MLFSYKLKIILLFINLFERRIFIANDSYFFRTMPFHKCNVIEKSNVLGVNECILMKKEDLEPC